MTIRSNVNHSQQTGKARQLCNTLLLNIGDEKSKPLLFTLSSKLLQILQGWNSISISKLHPWCCYGSNQTCVSWFGSSRLKRNVYMGLHSILTIRSILFFHNILLYIDTLCIQYRFVGVKTLKWGVTDDGIYLNDGKMGQIKVTLILESIHRKGWSYKKNLYLQF